MLVTFKTNSHGDITMFGNVAQSLLKMMGQSGNVPGAILADDVAESLNTLQANLKNAPEEETSANEDADDDSNKVALRTRAIPLIELLESAQAAGDNVLWES